VVKHDAARPSSGPHLRDPYAVRCAEEAVVHPGGNASVPCERGGDHHFGEHAINGVGDDLRDWTTRAQAEKLRHWPTRDMRHSRLLDKGHSPV
jgi:hypothetical protein